MTRLNNVSREQAKAAARAAIQRWEAFVLSDAASDASLEVMAREISVHWQAAGDAREAEYWTLMADSLQRSRGQAQAAA